MYRRLVVIAVVATTAISAPASPVLAAPANGLVKSRNQISIAYDPTSNACVSPILSRLGLPVPNQPDCLSYSSIALQAAGATPGSEVKLGGFDFQWPDTSSGQPDSLSPNGQTVSVNAPVGTNTLALLGMSDQGPKSSEIDLNYASADCNGVTSDQRALSFPDWWAPATSTSSPANALVSAFHLYGDAVPVPVRVGVFALHVPVDPSRKLVSVTFPAHSTSIRVFDLQPTTTPNTDSPPCGGSGQ